MNDQLEQLFPPPSFKEKVYRWGCRNFPHRWHSKTGWYFPVWWVYFFGGNWDSGNGGGWYPGVTKMFRRYYKEKWYEAGYTLWTWIGSPTKRGTASNHKKLNVNSHGLW